jgi:hypothetical protein
MAALLVFFLLLGRRKRIATYFRQSAVLKAIWTSTATAAGQFLELLRRTVVRFAQIGSQFAQA